MRHQIDFPPLSWTRYLALTGLNDRHVVPPSIHSSVISSSADSWIGFVDVISSLGSHWRIQYLSMLWCGDSQWEPFYDPGIERGKTNTHGLSISRIMRIINLNFAIQTDFFSQSQKHLPFCSWSGISGWIIALPFLPPLRPLQTAEQLIDISPSRRTSDLDNVDLILLYSYEWMEVTRAVGGKRWRIGD